MKKAITLSFATKSMLAVIAVCGMQLAVADTSAESTFYKGSPSVYAGVGGGFSYAPNLCDDSGLSDCEDTDLAVKVFGGARFHPNFAFEASYAHLGELSASIDIYGTPVNADFEASVLTANVLGIAPVNEKTELFAKFGLVRWDLDLTASANGFSESIGETGIDPVIGAGANIALTELLSLRFDLDYYLNLGDEDETGEEDILSVTAGLQFNF